LTTKLQADAAPCEKSFLLYQHTLMTLSSEGEINTGDGKAECPQAVLL
jgi:hypothetical protein